MTGPVRKIGIALFLAPLLGGCGSSAGPEDADGGTSSGETFLAFAGNFTDYHGWSQAPATPSEGTPADQVHPIGPWTLYWKFSIDPLQHGATTFPLGTIIVKQTDPGVVDPPQIFAMVKRGGGFNATGARDWEWFELESYDDGTVSIVWHGFGPPAGTEKYGGDGTVCNGCHAGAASNDYVWSSALTLSSF